MTSEPARPSAHRSLSRAEPSAARCSTPPPYLRSDDATSSPHEGDAGVVEVPLVLLCGLAHEHEALGVRDDLRGVQGLLEVVDELLLVALEGLGLGSSEDLAGADSLRLQAREAAGKDSLADQRYRLAWQLRRKRSGAWW